MPTVDPSAHRVCACERSPVLSPRRDGGVLGSGTHGAVVLTNKTPWRIDRSVHSPIRVGAG